MARPKKYRKICHFPKTLAFKPIGEVFHREPVKLTIDEYETIRLIDKEGRSQEECSVSMKVARTTVQMIYTSARRKISEAIVDGRILEIEGGDYDLCNGKPGYCSKTDCHKKKLYAEFKRAEDTEYRIAFFSKDTENKESEKEDIPGQEICVYISTYKEASKLRVYDMKHKEIRDRRCMDLSLKKEASFCDLLHILNVDLIILPEEESMADGLKELNIMIFRTNFKREKEVLEDYFKHCE